MSGGGGGDGGASKRQAEQEAKKQAARDALNVIFGVAPSAAANIDRNAFYRNASGGVASAPTNRAPLGYKKWGNSGDEANQSVYFDQAAYDAAIAAANAGASATAQTNKTARDALYTDIRNNAYTAGKRGIDEQTADAKRSLRFELFAKGLNGGSTDIDQNARLQRTYDNGILNLGAKADAAAADVRANDESTRLGLLQSIDAGMDQGSAISSALNQLKNNSDSAAAAATQTSIDDLFGNAGLLYQNSQRAQGVADARDAALYGSGSGSRKPKANTGTISGV